MAEIRVIYDRPTMAEVEAKITEQVSASVGPRITVSPTPPSNPQIGDLWILIE